jgi:hypothetical protein
MSICRYFVVASGRVKAWNPCLTGEPLANEIAPDA